MATFEHFYKSLSSNTQVRGKEFEEFVKWFLETDPRWGNQIKQIWLWDDHPKRDEWGPDCGIDLVFEHLNKEIWAVQAKCFEPSNSIRKEHMDSFIAESSDARFQKKLLVTSTNNVGPNVDRLLSRHNVVRILLDDLISADLEYPDNPEDYKNAKKIKKPEPYEYQKIAINKVLYGLQNQNKGQIHMACGTGKTLTALWIKEKLKAKNVLVLVPSLGLLSQTLKEWNKAAIDPFKWICVCSDKSVAKKDKTEDEWITNVSEIGVPVTSDVSEIKNFLSEQGSKVIFSTYQSSSLILEAQKDNETPYFDILIADEAHRCAGRVSNSFSIILDERKIRSHKRLFFTATPRILSNLVKGQAAKKDIEVSSMDDTSLFGKILYQLKFSDAINNDPPILSDYQVVIVGVDDPLIKEKISKRDLLTDNENNIIDAEGLAAQIALAKAIKDYNLKRVISFHGRVKGAQKFAEDIKRTIGWIPSMKKAKLIFQTDHISGSMKSSERNAKLKRLKNLKEDEIEVLTNARCLSEGVDVPTLDGVAFIDPKSSQIDIIQAVGRAIRKSEEKTLGTIIIPIYLGDTQNIEEEVLLSNFKNIWQILIALKSQDDILMETIDNLRIELGRKNRISRRTGFKKIIFDLPERFSDDFHQAIRTVLIKNTSDDWYEKFGLLNKYLDLNGNLRVKKTEDFELVTWIEYQRYLYRIKKIVPYKKDLLENLNTWTWNPHDDVWNEKYEELLEFVKKNGHTKPLQPEELRKWVAKQRVQYNAKNLSQSRINILEDINGWVWDPQAKEWEDKFKELLKFVEDNGNAKVKQSHPTLGTWVNSQRSKYKGNKNRSSLTQKQIDLLEGLNGWVWDPKAKEWEDKFKELLKFVEENGNEKVKQSHPTLGTWVNSQRSKYRGGGNRGSLTQKQIDLLEGLNGWSW